MKFQNRVIITGLIFSIFNLLLFAVGFYVILTHKFNPEDTAFYTFHPWWFIFKDIISSPNLLFNVLASILCLLLFSLSGNAGLRNLFRKTASPEIFFTITFIICLSLENLRTGIIITRVLSLSVYLSTALSQGVIFSRIFALLCLLVSSLYAVGMKYNNYPTLLGGVLLLSLTLAIIIPVDSTMLQVNFLHKLGDERGYMFLHFVLGLLIFLNYLVACLFRRSRRFLLIGAGALMLLIGKDLLYFGVTPLITGLGILLLTGGTVLFSRQVGNFYLWV